MRLTSSERALLYGVLQSPQRTTKEKDRIMMEVIDNVPLLWLVTRILQDGDMEKFLTRHLIPEDKDMLAQAGLKQRNT